MNVFSASKLKISRSELKIFTQHPEIVIPHLTSKFQILTCHFKISNSVLFSLISKERTYKIWRNDHIMI